MKSRNQSLDVLRGIAILLVLGRHYENVPWYRIGWAGVDLFFVLSGFLISGLLFTEYQRHGAINLKRFWIRRGLKIYPPFYALIIVTVAYSLLVSHSVPRAILGDIFFVQNYAPHIWNHGWSLAVEEHFYFLLPLVLLLMLRLRREDPFRWIPAVSIALTVLCLGLRVLAAPHTWENTFPSHLRIDALFMGVTLGYYQHFRLDSCRPTWLLPLAGVALLLPSFLLPFCIFTATAGLTLTFLGFGCIVFWAANQSARKFLAPLAWIGYYSYSIYLWHGVVGLYVFQALPKTVTFVALYFASSIFFGVVLAKLIEMPVLSARDRYFPSSTKHQSPQQITQGARAFVFVRPRPA